MANRLTIGLPKKRPDNVALVRAIRNEARRVRFKHPTTKALRRRRLLERDLGRWLRHYLAEAFPLPFGPDHLTCLEKISKAIRFGGLFAEALPRGDGKSTIVKGSCVYAMLTGYRRYVLSVSATEPDATAVLTYVKDQLEHNARLAEDYPEVVTFIKALDGKAIKARYQLDGNGDPTGIVWSTNVIVLATAKNKRGGRYRSSGAVLECRGITGALRGKARTTTDGTIIRPDFVILDDPQTRESAESEAQCKQRERVITGDILGLAGPRVKMTCVMPCTIIRKGDLASRFLDRKRHPEFQGETFRMVLKWPSAQDTLWEEYAAVWREAIASGRGLDEATSFYRANRAAMDAGASLSWQERVRTGELSALQTAENLLLEMGAAAFEAEMQNDPQDPETAEYDLPHDVVATRLNGQERRAIPDSAVILIGFVDINYDGLRWAIAGSTNTRNLNVIDYGIHPGNGRALYDPDNPRESVNTAVTRGLDGLDTFLRQLPLVRGEDRAELDRLLVDCGGAWMQAVFDWVQRVDSPLPWEPSRGFGSRGYRPNAKRIGKPGEQWHRARWPGKGRVLVHDADFWRMRQQRGWLLPAAAEDAITLFGTGHQRHDQVATQVVAEKLIAYADTPEGALYKWGLAPGAKNDWGDVMTGLYVAAATEGASPTGKGERKHGKHKKKAKAIIGRNSTRPRH